MTNTSQLEEQQLKKLALTAARQFAKTGNASDLEEFLDFVTAHVITHIKYQIEENNKSHKVGGSK